MSKFELRELNSKDIFPMVNLIKKFGIENFKKLLQNNDYQKIIDENGNVNGEQLQAMVGISIIFDVVGIIIDNIGNCEDELFAFLSNVSNLTKKEIANMPIDEFAELIIEVLSKKELKGFFGVVFKFLK